MVRNHHTERGGSAVEFALVLPLLLLILFGIIEFGLAFLSQQALTHATREGARLAIAARPVTDAEVSTLVQNNLSNAGLTGAVVSITPSASAATPGDPVQVQATTTYEMLVLPYSLNLQGSATMIKE